jgi:putative exosortase-associated protein (TIGR04073 family)
MRFRMAVFLFFCAVVAPSFASAEGTAGDYMYAAGAQFGRGLENVVTSLAEIPCTIHADMKDQGGSGFFPGLGKGTLYMFRRLLVGVTEVGTFFIPAERTIPRVCQNPKPSVA